MGKLPDGTPINMKNIHAKDILKIYPTFNNWSSRGMFPIIGKLSNDTLSFLCQNKQR